MSLFDDVQEIARYLPAGDALDALDRIEAENARLLEDNVRLSAGVMRLLREREAAVSGPVEVTDEMVDRLLLTRNPKWAKYPPPAYFHRLMRERATSELRAALSTGDDEA